MADLFPHTFTREQKLAAVERELVFRRRVYPNMVALKKMSAAKAKEQIDVFEAIANDYRVCACKIEMATFRESGTTCAHCGKPIKETR